VEQPDGVLQFPVIRDVSPQHGILRADLAEFGRACFSVTFEEVTSGGAANTVVPVVAQPERRSMERQTKKEPTMTTRAVEFLHVWVSENMTPFSQDEDNPEAKELARKCLAEAEEQGISYTELKEAAGGDLVAFIAGEIRRP
jgi:hypothetical protein